MADQPKPGTKVDESTHSETQAGQPAQSGTSVTETETKRREETPNDAAGGKSE